MRAMVRRCRFGALSDQVLDFFVRQYVACFDGGVKAVHGMALCIIRGDEIRREASMRSENVAALAALPTCACLGGGFSWNVVPIFVRGQRRAAQVLQELLVWQRSDMSGIAWFTC